jgi:hypothetical protein
MENENIEISNNYESLPENDNEVLEVKSTVTEDDNIELAGNNSYYVERYYLSGFISDSAYKTFIKGVERAVRKSPEYTKYLGELRRLGLYRDTFQANINDENATIEFHHYPFTLYDIAVIVTDACLTNKMPISTFLVAGIIMDLHYKHRVGLVPLCLTNHQLAHSGKLFISLDKIFGYYNEFVEDYKDYIPIDIKDKYNKIIELSNANTPPSENDILSIN